MSKAPSSCRMLLEQLSAYLDGDLSAKQCERVARHARECPRCKTLIADLRETAGLCHEAAERPLPPSVRRRAQAGIRRLLEGDSASPTPRRRR